MTLASSTTRNDYTGNGATSVYAYTFKIFTSSDLLVLVQDTSGNITTLAINTDYTVSGAGGVNGGNVTLVNASQAWLTGGFLTNGWKLSILRARALTQLTDIRNQSSFYPETHEDTFDSLAMIDQQQQEQLDRAVKLPKTVLPSASDPTLPVPSGGKAFRWNPGGTALVAYDPTLISGTAVFPGSNGIAIYTGSNTLISRTLTAGTGITVTNGDGQSGNPTVAVTSGGITKSLLDSSTTSMGDELTNLTLVASVAANALTVALKSKAATDPSASDPVTIGFRHGTANNGGYNRRQVTGALSVVVASGASLGQVNNQPQYVWVYAIDNAGTVELAVSGQPIADEGALVTTTTMSAGATDPVTLYSTTGRASVPVRFIGRVKATEATAGTWASAPTEISVGTFEKKRPRSEVWVYTANGYGSTNTKIRRWTTTGRSVGGAITYADSATNGGSFTINEDGVYAISYSEQFGVAERAGISVNSSQLTTNINSITAADRRACSLTPGANLPTTVQVTLFLSAGDVVRGHTQGSAGGTSTESEHFRIVKVSD